MPFRFYKILFLLFFIVCFQFSNAQEIWDWKTCIEYAMQNNLQLKQTDLNVKLEQVNLQKNKLSFTPSINGSSNYNLRIGNNFNFFSGAYERQLVHYNDYGINLSQPIFDGLITQNSVQKSKIDLEALKLDQEVLRNNIQLQILTAFLNIMNANEQLNQTIKQKESTLEQYEHTKTLIDAGAAAEKALLDIDAQLTTEDLSISQVKNQLELTYLNLKILLQLEPNKEIKVKIPDLPDGIEIQELASLQRIYSDALTLRPEIKSADKKIKSAEKSIKIAKGNNYPTLSFVGNLNTFFTSQSKNSKQEISTTEFTPIGFVENTTTLVLQPKVNTTQTKNPYFNQLKQNLNYAFGLSLNVPIYNKFLTQSAVKQANLQVQLSQLQKKQAETDLFNTISQAYLKSQAAIENFKAAKKNFETAKKSYDYAVERLNAGSINQLEVNLSKNNLASAESKLTQAKYEFVFNTKVLDFYQGKNITLE
ncbi:MAG TPA: TolC family protein [Chitinophagales bacterium]|nr:TolC family protein [Chitinophagales bacterium]